MHNESQSSNLTRRGSQHEDDFYTYDIVQLGCPSKWFEKTSGTRVYLKSNEEKAKLQISERLRYMVSVCEQRGDQKLLREIFRKNLWKYKKEDFLKNDLKKFG